MCLMKVASVNAAGDLNSVAKLASPRLAEKIGWAKQSWRNDRELWRAWQAASSLPPTVALAYQSAHDAIFMVAGASMQSGVRRAWGLG